MNNVKSKPELVLGTAQLGTGYGINNSVIQDEAGCVNLLRCAWNCGIRTLDTAEGYGPSESMIGAYHRKHPDSTFSICTKLPGSIDPKSLATHLQESIDKMSVDIIDIYYMHSFTTCKELESIEALESMQSNGLLNQIGVSIYEPTELRFIIDNLCDVISVVQIPFNVFDCARWLNDNLLQEAEARGLELFVRSVYLQGTVFKELDDPILEKIGLGRAMIELESIAQSLDISRAQLALDFVKDTPQISSVILGSETTEQIESNVSMMSNDSPWSQEKRQSMISISAALEERAVDPRKWHL